MTSGDDHYIDVIFGSGVVNSERAGEGDQANGGNV